MTGRWIDYATLDEQKIYEEERRLYDAWKDATAEVYKIRARCSRRMKRNRNESSVEQQLRKRIAELENQIVTLTEISVVEKSSCITGLSKYESRIYALLKKQEYATSERLLQAIYFDARDVRSTRTLMVTISKLRKKLSIFGASIKFSSNWGYYLREAASLPPADGQVNSEVDPHAAASTVRRQP